MDEGHRVLQWAQQHQYALTWVAQRLGFDPQALSEALDHNRISQELADALLAHFGLRVLVNAPWPNSQDPTGCPGACGCTNGEGD